MDINKKSFAKTTLVRTNHVGTFSSPRTTSEDREQTIIACLGDVPLTMVLTDTQQTAPSPRKSKCLSSDNQ